MIIYIVIWEDRHSDTTAHPFLDLDQAKAWALGRPETLGYRVSSKNIQKVEGWEYCMNYGSENSLWITKHEVE